MKITMQDVAKKAGVSTATVSHVINNTRFVSDETAAKVQGASGNSVIYPIRSAVR